MGAVLESCLTILRVLEPYPKCVLDLKKKIIYFLDTYRRNIGVQHGYDIDTLAYLKYRGFIG